MMSRVFFLVQVKIGQNMAALEDIRRLLQSHNLEGPDVVSGPYDIIVAVLLSEMMAMEDIGRLREAIETARGVSRVIPCISYSPVLSPTG